MLRRTMLLRGLATLAVVANHTVMTALFPAIWSTLPTSSGTASSGYFAGWAGYWTISIIAQACIFAAPAYLIASGASCWYAFGASSGPARWRSTLGFLPHVVIPYLIWSCVALLKEAVMGRTYPLEEWAVSIITGRTEVDAYYFVVVLIQFYFLAPFVPRIVGKRGLPWALVVSGALVGAYVCLRYAYHSGRVSGALIGIESGIGNLDRLFLRWSFYYILGYALARDGRTGAWLRRYSTVLLSASVLAFGASIAELALRYNTPSDFQGAQDYWKASSTVYATIAPFAVLALRPGLAKSLPGILRRIEHLGLYSYGVFLSQPMMLWGTRGVVRRLFPDLVQAPLALFLVLLSGSCAGCWLLHVIVTRTRLRGIAPFLLGYRSPVPARSTGEHATGEPALQRGGAAPEG